MLALMCFCTVEVVAVEESAGQQTNFVFDADIEGGGV